MNKDWILWEEPSIRKKLSPQSSRDSVSFAMKLDFSLQHFNLVSGKLVLLPPNMRRKTETLSRWDSSVAVNDGLTLLCRSSLAESFHLIFPATKTQQMIIPSILQLHHCKLCFFEIPQENNCWFKKGFVQQEQGYCRRYTRVNPLVHAGWARNKRWNKKLNICPLSFLVPSDGDNFIL